MIGSGHPPALATPPAAAFFKGSRRWISSALYEPMIISARASSLVLATRYENLPSVLIEGMAAGLPVVASRVGGIPALIDHDVNGLLVPPGDAAALAAAIYRILGDPGTAARLAAARRTVGRGTRVRKSASEELGELRAGTLPDQAIWKFRRDSRRILDAQRLIAASDAKVAFGTDCGMFPFSHGIREFQAMAGAGLSPIRALRSATSVAAELLGRDDLGVLKPGACADIVAMPGDPPDDITATARVDFVMRSGTVHRRPGDGSPVPG